MAQICCKRCKVSGIVKNGIVRSLQRYLCKSCGFNFTNTPKRGKSEAVKDLALAMYSLGNMSFRGIGAILGISNVTVLTWVRDRAKNLPDVPPPPAAVAAGDTPAVAATARDDVKPVVLVDEMWHFIQKKLQSSGYGELSIRLEKELSHGSLESAMMKLAKSCSKKSASMAKTSSLTIGRATTGLSRRINSSPAKI